MVENKLKWASERKLKYILELQENGKSLEEIAVDMGYKDLRQQTKFMSNQGYIRVNDKYVLRECDNSSTVEDNDIMEDNSSTNVIQANEIALEGVSDDKEDKYTISVLQSTESKEKLTNMLNNYSELLEMLEWFKGVKAKYPTVDIPLFNIDYEKSSPTKTTVRVDEGIWKDFSNLCKTKYSHLSKVDIVSQILSNFIEENK